MLTQRPWWQSVKPTSPELELLSGRCGHLCEPIMEEPGWFAVREGVDVRFQGHPLDPGDRPIHFSLFDPDIRGLPFHRTAEFLTVPPLYRFGFLMRNPYCVDALLRCIQAGHFLAIRQRAAEGFIQAGPEGETLLSAVTELRDRFGIRPVWIREGSVLDPPDLALEESFPDSLPTLGRTERERRCFRKCFAARRRELGIRAPRRQPDDYYRRLLAVWDAREGWVGRPSKGYDPELALPLQLALEKAGAGSCVEDYYRAFQLVSGMEYSIAAWLTTLGIFWLKCRREIPRRRGTGRKKGERSRKDLAVIRFLELLRNGASIDEAVQVAGLTGEAARVLSDPENWDAIRELMQYPERVRELIASLQG
jgi:hypothetical protein